VFTTGKLATIAFVLALAVSLDAPPEALAADARPTASFAVAAGAVWYTFLGWQDVVLLAEELHEPRRTLSVVLVGTVAIVMVLYVGIHMAVYLGLGGGATAYGDLPALELATRALGSTGAGIMGALMLASMVGGAAEGMMVRPRLAMALGRDGLAPSVFAAVNRAGTPWAALLFHGSLVFALVATGSFAELLPLLVFAQGLLGVFETVSYFAVRRKRPDQPTSRFHPWAPLLFLAANLTLCVLAGLDDPLRAGLALMLLSLVAAAYGLLSLLRTREAP
jgi:APA family basic amino acid/polyamine antiporter